MSALRLGFVLSLLVAATSAFATEPPVDARIRQVENGLLPQAALTKDLGKTVTLEQRMRDLGIPGVSIAVID